MLRVPRPRVESIRRSVAGHATPGDLAVVGVGPGLLALLEHPFAGQSGALGAGYHGRYSAPLGLAISAALALVEPATPVSSAWLGREATVEWLALPALDATLRGDARLTALSAREAVFSIRGWTEGGDQLLRGQVLLVLVADGRPVGYPAGAGSGPAPSLSERARDRRAAATASTPGLHLRSAPAVLPLGHSTDVVVELVAPEPAGAAWVVTARPPLAGGLSLERPAERTLTLGPAASETVTFTVRADRPDAVNDGRPWVLELRATGGAREEALSVAIAVPDPDPARSVEPLDVRDETTQSLLAWTAPEPCAADLAQRTLRFPIRLLGRGIRVDADHPVAVTVAPPESVDTVAIGGFRVVQGGRVLGTGRATVGITLVDRETPVELELELTREGTARAKARFSAAATPLTERSEPLQSDLMRLRPPTAGSTPGSYRVSPDVVRLLLNPIAGHGEPLGRRMHPLSGLSVGASLTAAFGLAGESLPGEPRRARAAALWIRWLALPDLSLDLEARGRVESRTGGGHTVRVEVFDGSGRRASESEVVVADSSGEAVAAAAALLERRHIERAHPAQRSTPSAIGSAIARVKTRLGGLWQRLYAPGSTAGRETPGS